MGTSPLSLTQSLSIPSLSLFLSHFIIRLSLTHFLHPLADSLFFFLCFTFSLSHTLILSFVTITANCHSVFYKIQVLEIEGDRVQHAWSMRKKKTGPIEQIVVRAKALIFCRLRTLGTSHRVQSGPGYFLWPGDCYISIATGYCLP